MTGIRRRSAWLSWAHQARTARQHAILKHISGRSGDVMHASSRYLGGLDIGVCMPRLRQAALPAEEYWPYACFAEHAT